MCFLIRNQMLSVDSNNCNGLFRWISKIKNNKLHHNIRIREKTTSSHHSRQNYSEVHVYCSSWHRKYTIMGTFRTSYSPWWEETPGKASLLCPMPRDGPTRGANPTVLIHGHRRSERFRAAPTFVCLCFGPGWCGWWLGWSGQKSPFCWRNGTNGKSATDWFETGRRCGQTASGRISGLRAPAQTHTVDWLWHT